LHDETTYIVMQGANAPLHDISCLLAPSCDPLERGITTGLDLPAAGDSLSWAPAYTVERAPRCSFLSCLLAPSCDPPQRGITTGLDLPAAGDSLSWAPAFTVERAPRCSVLSCLLAPSCDPPERGITTGLDLPAAGDSLSWAPAEENRKAELLRYKRLHDISPSPRMP
jgi:hypothetical protein